MPEKYSKERSDMGETRQVVTIFEIFSTNIQDLKRQVSVLNNDKNRYLDILALVDFRILRTSGIILFTSLKSKSQTHRLSK